MAEVKGVKKPSNPKDAIGIKKVPMSCLSSQVVALVAQAYCEENLRSCNDPGNPILSEHFDAATAYLMLFWEGYNDDQKVPYLARAMAHIMVIRAAELDGTLEDDRVRRNNQGVHMAGLNAKAAKVIEKISVCVDPFTRKKAGTLGFRVAAPITNDTPLHTLPWQVVLEMALGMMEGGRKYGRHNYRAIGVRASVYYDATMRHLTDYLAGNNIDQESGLSHLSKALSSSQVLMDSMVMGNWEDDRPLRVK